MALSTTDAQRLHGDVPWSRKYRSAATDAGTTHSPRFGIGTNRTRRGKDHSAEFTRSSDWTSLHPLAWAQRSIGTTSISLILRCFSSWEEGGANWSARLRISLSKAARWSPVRSFPVVIKTKPTRSCRRKSKSRMMSPKGPSGILTRLKMQSWLFWQIEYCFNFTYLMLHSGGVSKRTTQTAKSGGTSLFKKGMSVGPPPAPRPGIPSQGFPSAFVWSAATVIAIGLPSPAREWAGHSKMSKAAQKERIRWVVSDTG